MNEIDNFSLMTFDRAIQTLKKWKIIPFKSFYLVSSDTHKKTYSYKYLARLINAGIATKMKLPQTNACVVLPSKRIIEDFNIPLTKEQFTHDTVVSYVASAFMTLPHFKDSEFIFEHESGKFHLGSVIPDLEIKGVDPKSFDEFHFAIEIELSRKAFSKIDDKLRKYAQDRTFDHVVYFFTSEDLYQLFKKRISTWEEGGSKILSGKISLVFVTDYLSLHEKMMDLKCFSNGSEGILRDFF